MGNVIRIPTVVGLFAVLWLGACSPAAETPASIPEGASEPLHGVVEGLYVYGHEVRTFQPCGTHRVLWLQGAEDLLTTLKESHQVLTALPYEEVFVRLRGDELPAAAEGFAADYDGIWLVEEVLEIRKRKDGDCGE